ncbi:hypothetical protein K474DRAFT_1063910 [Panus rudis PR-1116 ss-1]|nr:hypothetical protein K474DRAFT_1063910 [Panus rudis PR-1116 ss-1]
MPPFPHRTAIFIPDLGEVRLRDHEYPTVFHSFPFDQLYRCLEHERSLRARRYRPNVHTVPCGFDDLRVWWHKGDPDCVYQWSSYDYVNNRPIINGRMIPQDILVPGLNPDDLDPLVRKRRAQEYQELSTYHIREAARCARLEERGKRARLEEKALRAQEKLADENPAVVVDEEDRGDTGREEGQPEQGTAGTDSSAMRVDDDVPGDSNSEGATHKVA